MIIITRITNCDRVLSTSTAFMKTFPRYAIDPVLQWMMYLVFGALILYFGRTLFIPLSFSVLISFVLYPICAWLEKKKFNRTSAILVALLLLVLLATGAVFLLVQQFIGFLHEWPVILGKLQDTIHELSSYITATFQISQEQQREWLQQWARDSSGSAFAFLQALIRSSGSSLVWLVLIPIFSGLILYYRHMLVRVAYRIFDTESRDSINRILSLTISTYYRFIKGMLVVYLIVGILNSLGLWLLGVPHAFFFGFMASILTFIPYVGIMVGSLMPMAMAWITYDSAWYALGVVGVFAVVQYLEANVIFPLAVSSRLSINALATLCAILIGGVLWGVAGMILFVPFVAIVKLIADQHPRMKTISILIGHYAPQKSANGDHDHDAG